MNKYVLDSSALLRYIDDEAGSDTVLRVFKEARDGQCRLLMSAVNWGEVIFVTAKAHGVDAARELAAHLRCMPFQVVPVEPSDAEGAALFRHNFKVPYADAFAGHLALREDAALITADFDFKSLPNIPIKLEFLPKKKAKGHCGI
jgi:predicted nucleic acid-binding protein